MGVVWVSVQLVEGVGAVDPWAGKVVEPHFQSRAMLEDELDGQGFQSGSVGAAGLAAIAAVREGHMHQSASIHHPEDLDGEADQWDMGGLEALHDHLHYSEGTRQEDIQDPLDSVSLDSEDVGVESVAAQMVHCSGLLDNPDWDKDQELVSEGQHSRKGWRGGNHL